MSEPDRPATDPTPDPNPRRAFFPGRPSGQDKDEPAADSPTLTGPPALAVALRPGPPAGSLTQTPAPAAAVSPRITLPSAPAMPPPDPTPASPDHALAQLTFSFGITSLQLTPFFRLGSLDLRALSDVVSLRFVAARSAEHPLAAGVSFRVEDVRIDGTRLRSLGLRPLDDSRPVPAPRSDLQVNDVAVADTGDAPITVTTAADGAPTAVQLVVTFAVAEIDFSPAFEVESLRLTPASGTALLRVVPSERPTALDLPPSFDFAEVRVDDAGQLERVRLVPGASRAA